MSGSRKIRRAVYSATVALSIIAGTITGYTAPELTGEYFPEPYAANIFYSTSSAGAERFTDMKDGDWFYGYVDMLVRDGVINGKSDTTYDPQGTLTVPECAALLVRCLGLEDEAAVAASELKAAGAAGSDKWYAGYMSVCVGLGIIDADVYGFGYDVNGVLCEKEAQLTLKNVKRYELAAFLSRMTMLDYASIEAKNNYSERGGEGHEFIRGGLYESSVLSMYQNEIKDFDKIPESYRGSVLRCYYNAIFNGDAVGNFNPENNLTRAEMAKIVATLTDMSLRFGNDYRTDAYVPLDSDFVTKASGEKTLKKQVGYRILEKCAKLLTLNPDGTLRLTLASVAPLGYTIEAHAYADWGSTCFKIGTIGTGTDGVYESGSYINCLTYDTPKLRVVYILRNTAKGGKVEGVLEASMNSGTVSFSDGISYPVV